MPKELRFEDKAGREVKPGDLIVYGHALGRCAGLQYGKVLGLQPEKREKWDTREPATKLKVQGVNGDWEMKYLELLRPSVLAFSDRILVVERSQVHPKILAKLDTVVVKDG